MALNLHLKKGALHTDLGIPQGQPIPTSKLSTKPGDSALERRRKRLALTMRTKWHHGGKTGHGVG